MTRDVFTIKGWPKLVFILLLPWVTGVVTLMYLLIKVVT